MDSLPAGRADMPDQYGHDYVIGPPHKVLKRDEYNNNEKQTDIKKYDLK